MHKKHIQIDIEQNNLHLEQFHMDMEHNHV
jgi:hypothetical protein